MNKVKELYSYGESASWFDLIEQINEFGEKYEILNVQYIYTPDFIGDGNREYRAHVLYKEEKYYD